MRTPLLLLLLVTVYTGAILNGFPLTFTMTGGTTYIPDAGSATQSGYTINLGFVGSSWIAAELITPSGNTDVLVVQIDDFYTTSSNGQNKGHIVTYHDYFKNASGLQLDTITTYDVSSYTYSSTMTYQLPITRSLGSNSGQDWPASAQAYSVLKVCFYTSSTTFSLSAFNSATPTCYNYEINNLVSTFVGPYIKSFMLNGYTTSIYGYIDGPYLSNKVYFYQEAPQFSYVQVPAVAIEIGTTNGGHGQDFYVSSPVSAQNGDYYGSNINNITKDNFASGYQNPALTLAHWNADPGATIAGLSKTCLRISFTRQIYTYDPYDKQMLSTFLFCMYMYTSGSVSGSLSDKSCQVIELSKSFLEMSVSSSSWEKWTGIVGLGMLMVMMF